MAFLMSRCAFGSTRKSMLELSGLKCMFTELRPSVITKKKFLPTVQSQHFATEKDIKVDETQLETKQIYRGSLTRQVRSIKLLTIMSSVTGLFAQPVMYTKIQELGLSAAVIGIGVFYGFFVIVSPFLIHLLTKRYVTEVEYNLKDDCYTAYTYSFFLQKKKIQFKPDDVQVPKIPAMFTTIVVKKTPLFLDPKMFDEPSHFARIMGYDKPIDFSFESNSEDRKK